MISFNDKYAKIHEEIRQDASLVKRIYECARECKEVAKTSKKSRAYLSCERLENGLFIGVQYKRAKTRNFTKSLAKFRLLYEESNGEVDIPRVYSLLDYEDRAWGINCYGILSEDMSEGGSKEIEETSGDLDPILFRIFSPVGGVWEKVKDEIAEDFCDWDEFLHSTFEVYNKSSNEYERFPIVDIDNLSVNSEFQEKYVEYYKEYVKKNSSKHMRDYEFIDERFMIHEVSK